MPSTVSYSRRIASGACCGSASTVSARRTASRHGSTISKRVVDRQRDRDPAHALRRAALFQPVEHAAVGPAAETGDQIGGPAGKKRQRLRRPACRCAAPPRATPRATSRRTARPAASPRSALRAGSRRAGSSCRVRFSARNAARSIGWRCSSSTKDQQPMVGHPLRVEDAVEVVAFVLHDAGVKALDLALDDARRRGRSPR